MAQSATTIDQGKVYQGTATGGGSFTAAYTIPTDQAVWLRAHCIASHATTSHLDSAAHLFAEYFVQSKNTTVTAPSVVGSSVNPGNSSTASFQPSGVQAADATVWSGGAPSLVWSISGQTAVATFTNTGATSTVNVTIVIEAISVGST